MYKYVIPVQPVNNIGNNLSYYFCNSHSHDRAHTDHAG